MRQFFPISTEIHCHLQNVVSVWTAACGVCTVHAVALLTLQTLLLYLFANHSWVWHQGHSVRDPRGREWWEGWCENWERRFAQGHVPQQYCSVWWKRWLPTWHWRSILWWVIKREMVKQDGQDTCWLKGYIRDMTLQISCPICISISITVLDFP